MVWRIELRMGIVGAGMLEHPFVGHDAGTLSDRIIMANSAQTERSRDYGC